MKPTIYSFTLVLLLLALCWARPLNAQENSTETPTLAQACATNSTLADVLEKTGLMAMLSNKGPYTFFAPTDAAINQLAQLDPMAAREILLGHIIEGRLTAAELHDGAVLTTLAKQTLKVCRKKNKLMLNGMVVTATDQPAANGIMHTVNGLLAKNIMQAGML